MLKTSESRRFKNGQRVWWKAFDDSRQEGTVEDYLLKVNNPHLMADSYLVTMDFDGMTRAVDAKRHNMNEVF